jgi:hypothetical protein
MKRAVGDACCGEHFIHGKSIKEIARDRRLSRNTVRKVGAFSRSSNSSKAD